MRDRELIELALTKARDGFEEAVQRLIDAAGNDATRLSDAAKELTAATKEAGSAEHIAFTYLSAAFKRVADAGRAATSGR